MQRSSGGAILWLALAFALAFPAITLTALSVARAAAAPVLAAVKLPNLPAATRPSSPHGGGRVARPPRQISFTTSHGCSPRGDWSRVDPRVRTVLVGIAVRHSLRVSCLHTGHSRFVKGTRRVSNHTVWRAADIDLLDGQPVSRRHRGAYTVALALGQGRYGARPSEVGSPWSFGRRPWFTDAGHQGHLHIGFRP